MLRHRLVVALGTLLAMMGLAFAASAVQASYQDDDQPTGSDLLIAGLQQGGYTIFIRHALEEGEDRLPLELDDCSFQQTLTNDGRAQARSIGASLANLNIPVGPVLSSPLCRARETAARAFGGMDVRDILGGPNALDPSAQAGQVEAVRALLATVPDVGTNIIVVSHSALFVRVVGMELDRGEAAIIAPDGQGGLEVVATIASDRWPQAVSAD